MAAVFQCSVSRGWWIKLQNIWPTSNNFYSSLCVFFLGTVISEIVFFLVWIQVWDSWFWLSHSVAVHGLYSRWRQWGSQTPYSVVFGDFLCFFQKCVLEDVWGMGWIVECVCVCVGGGGGAWGEEGHGGQISENWRHRVFRGLGSSRWSNRLPSRARDQYPLSWLCMWRKCSSFLLRDTDRHRDKRENHSTLGPTRTEKDSTSLPNQGLIRDTCKVLYNSRNVGWPQPKPRQTN